MSDQAGRAHVGFLIYGSELQRIPFADVLLAHLQAVAAVKLRRDESYFMSWDDDGKPQERRALWMDRGIVLRFNYTAPVRPALDVQVVERLVVSAGSSGGLDITRYLHAPSLLSVQVQR